MSTPEITPEQAVENLRFLTRDYLPEAIWTVGGALRFDKSLLTLNNFLSQIRTGACIRSTLHWPSAPTMPRP